MYVEDCYRGGARFVLWGTYVDRTLVYRIFNSIFVCTGMRLMELAVLGKDPPCSRSSTESTTTTETGKQSSPFLCMNVLYVLHL